MTVPIDESLLQRVSVNLVQAQPQPHFQPQPRPQPLSLSSNLSLYIFTLSLTPSLPLSLSSILSLYISTLSLSLSAPTLSLDISTLSLQPEWAPAAPTASHPATQGDMQASLPVDSLIQHTYRLPAWHAKYVGRQSPPHGGHGVRGPVPRWIRQRSATERVRCEARVNSFCPGR